MAVLLHIQCFQNLQLTYSAHKPNTLPVSAEFETDLKISAHKPNPVAQSQRSLLVARTMAYYHAVDGRLHLLDARLTEFDTGASTPQSACSAVGDSDGGLTVFRRHHYRGGRP